MNGLTIMRTKRNNPGRRKPGVFRRFRIVNVVELLVLGFLGMWHVCLHLEWNTDLGSIDDNLE